MGWRTGGGSREVDTGLADANRLALGEVERAFYRLLAATGQNELANEVLAPVHSGPAQTCSQRQAFGSFGRAPRPEPAAGEPPGAS